MGLGKKKIECVQSCEFKIGFWNKGGALQPLYEKINEIEDLIKSNNFSVFGIIEANLFSHNKTEDVQISEL